ncbi:MAG: hypothetical protein DHS20C18_45000 [Saprospiraceae bacterium]|nr:MAG: hypothetical protein DHS20C18_45000 [Saprospiraceae bacterium]
MEHKAQIFPNGDFESGDATDVCHCPTGFTCVNDAGRVVDGIHPLFVLGKQGCVNNGTNYVSPLGAFNGTGYVYFYAGRDKITSRDIKFDEGQLVEMCVWYSGPQGAGELTQDTALAHFSFAIDGVRVGPGREVPTGTIWTQYCYTDTVTTGNHNFGIFSGGPAKYSMWFDGFSVVKLCDLPVIDLGRDTTLCSGETITLAATSPNTSCLWSDHSTDPTFITQQEGTYWVQVSNACGTVSDTVLIQLADSDCKVYTPNAFSPNWDNVNDQFAPLFHCAFSDYNFIVFDRWGGKVFHTNNPRKAWDGTFNGSVCPAGVYVYLVHYSIGGKMKVEKGSVVLMR